MVVVVLAAAGSQRAAAAAAAVSYSLLPICQKEMHNRQLWIREIAVATLVGVIVELPGSACVMGVSGS